MKISPNLSLLFLSLGLFTAVQAKDGRWIDTADPTIPVDFKYQGEYIGTLESGGKMGCQVVSLGAGVFQAVLYPGGLPGAGWDGKNRSIMDGKLWATKLSSRLPPASGLTWLRHEAGKRIRRLPRCL